MLPKLSQFCWTELATNNLELAKEFYGNVFGWKFLDHDIGDSTYTMIMLEDKQFGEMWSIPKDQKEMSHWMVYVYVENLDRSLEQAVKNGAKIIKKATKVHDFGYYAIIADPTGAHIALWEPQEFI